MPTPPCRGLVITPGASAGRDHPSLLAIERAVTGVGVAVERVEFPYTAAGRRRPDPPAVCTAVIAEAAAGLAARLGTGTDQIAVGGRSFGGRMASLAAAEGLAVAALVLVSYPLHPPGRPDRMRTGHFGSLDVACLFVSGTRDAFGTPAEFDEAVRLLPGPVTQVWIEGGDHGLRRRDEEAAAAVARFLAGQGGSGRA